MVLEDIITIDNTEDMLTVAKSESVWLHKNKVGASTRPLTESRDITGSLAHQAIEVALTKWRLPFTSYRSDRIKQGGDKLDILYDDDKIDVKGTCRDFNDRWFFNTEFLVIADQLNAVNTKGLSHFCFVEVSKDLRYSRIYGVISVREFLKRAEMRVLKYRNLAIRAKNLTPFRQYAFRSNG